MSGPEDDLREVIARRDAVVIAGAGIAAAACGGQPVASWRGLLENGIEECEKYAVVEPHWAELQRRQLELGNLDSWLSVAEQITNTLGGRTGGAFRAWLRRTVGSLKPTSDGAALVDALVGLGVPIATTNYDGLIEAPGRLEWVTWRDGSGALEILRGNDEGVIHLHGHWRESASVILGMRSYESVLGDEAAQAMLQALATMRPLVLVGFGAGLQDPNFAALRSWLAKTWPGAERQHFRLVRESERDAVAAEHSAAERIVPVVYGESHADLEPFLRRLANRGGGGAPASEAFDLGGRPFEFHGVDLRLQVLVGSLGSAFGREDVHASLIDASWTAPPDLRALAGAFADGKFYDGDVARLTRINVATYRGERGTERHRIHLEMAPTGFFDYLATNVALGPFTHDEAPLLAGRSGIADTPLSNMVGLDLTLISRDGYVPVFLRSSGMASLERCRQTSSGETLQLEKDIDTDGSPDVFHTALRGLDEELHVRPEQVSDLAVTALVATPEFANIGVLMRGTLDLTRAELESEINLLVLKATDNWEYTGHAILAIDDVDELAAALTSAGPGWTKQAAASLIFAHAERARGNVRPLARAITAAGGLNLHSGSDERNILPEDHPLRQRPRPWPWDHEARS